MARRRRPKGREHRRFGQARRRFRCGGPGLFPPGSGAAGANLRAVSVAPGPIVGLFRSIGSILPFVIIPLFFNIYGQGKRAVPSWLERPGQLFGPVSGLLWVCFGTIVGLLWVN